MAGATLVTAYGNANPNAVDMMAFGSEIAALRIESDAGDDTIAVGAGDDVIYAGMGTDAVWLTPDADDSSADTVVYQTLYEGKTLPVTTLTFSSDVDDYREGSVLKVQVNGTAYSHTVTAGQTQAQALAAFATAIEASDAVGTVIVHDNVLEILGATTGTRLAIVTDKGSPDSIVDISNPGLKTVWKVEFSDDAADYPGNASLLETFAFPRKVSVTIAGVTVEADVAYSNGTPHPEATLVNLKDAIDAKMVQGEALEDVLGAVAIEANGGDNDVVLVLTGKTAPATDGDAPTFSVTAASIEVGGEQQQTSVSFSSVDADYYAGGTLSVTVADQTITADMVAGNAHDSVQNLVNAVNDRLTPNQTVFQFDYDIDANTQLNKTHIGWLKYQIALKIGNVSALEQAPPSFVDVPQTVGEVVLFLNQIFASVAQFELDAEANRITARTLNAADTITGYWGGDPQIFIAVEGTDGEPGLAVVSKTGVFDAALAELLEGALQSDVDSWNLILTARDEAEDPLHATAEMAYAGEAQTATLSLDDAAAYTEYADGTGTARGADVYYEGGKAYVTIHGAGEDGILGGAGGADDVYVTIPANMGEDAAATTTNLVAAINAATAEGGDLYGIIAVNGASVDEVGVITLTAAANGEQTFEVSDVLLDYAGVKQLATVTLDPLGSYGEYSFTDGPGDWIIRNGAGPGVYFAGGKVWLTITPSGGEPVTVSAAMGLDEEETADALKAAIEAELGQDGSLRGVIGGVTRDGAGLTLEAATAGDQTFTVSAITLDYQGLKQIATADFSTTDGDYYAGGKTYFAVTHAGADGVMDTDDDVVTSITVDMKDDDAAGTLADLVAAIQKEIDGTAAVEADPGQEGVDAVAALPAVWVDETYNGGAQSDLVLLAGSGPFNVFFDGFVNGVRYEENVVVWGGPGSNLTVGDFIDALNGLFDSADVPIQIHAALLGGNLTITTESTGVNATLANLHIGADGVEDAFTHSGADAVGEDGIDGIDAIPPTEGSDYIPGALTDIVGAVSVDANGVITLTSAGNVKHAFDITKAQIDDYHEAYAGLQQTASVTFDGGEGSYYDVTAYDGGEGTVSQIGLTLHGHTFQQNMIAGEPAATVAALKEQIDSAFDWALEYGEGSAEAVFATWLNTYIDSVSVTGSKITFTAAYRSADDTIELEESFMTVAPVTQVTKVDLSGIDFDPRKTSAGAAAQVGLTIAGTTVTADVGADNATTLANLKTAIQAKMAAGQALENVLGAVDLTDGVFTLTAKVPGADPLDVASVQHQVEDAASALAKPQIVLLSFDDEVFDDAAQTPLGTVITVKIDGIEASVEVTEPLLDGVSPALRSETIVAALKDAILAEAGETEGSTVGTIEQGYLDRGVFTAVAEAGLQDADNVLRITANTNGAYTLGRAVDGTLSITVTEPGPNPGDEPVPVLLSVTASVTQVGNLVYTWSSDEVVSVDTAGRDEGLLVREGAILTFDGAEVPADVLATMPTDSTPGDPAVAAYTDRIDQTIVNAGPGWAEDGTQLNYYGDAPQIGAMDGPGGAFNGAGVGQSYANPADGATHTEGSAQDAVASGEDGDDGFRGDAARIGENDGDDGSFNGQGVQQTHTNPDGWYTAIPGSPAWGERDDGDNSDLYGSNAGYYADDGLHTTYLNGGTATGDAGEDGTYLYTGRGEDDFTGVIDSDDTVNVGAAAGSNAVAVGEDAFQDGFAPFDWDSASTHLVTLGNAGPDVIHNFQTDHDFIGLEGALLASTEVGGVQAIVGGEGAPFDLDDNEFGLVGSLSSTLDAEDLGDASEVATLLNQLFEFGAAGEDSALNTSVFSVTAADDPNVTAIWAHRQSSAGDSTVEAVELYQLALVNTLGNEFDSRNFAQAQPLP